MPTRRLIGLLNSRSLFGLCVLVLLFVPQAALAQSLTVEPITWDVIGLDSNDVSVGPNRFPVGARVCAVGGSLTNVQSTFVWDDGLLVHPYINLRSGSLNPITYATLPSGECTDFFYEVEVVRVDAARGTTRNYHIDISSTEGASGSTPIPRQLVVEYLVSQSRNAILDMQYGTDGVAFTSVASGGTMTLAVGETYFIKLVASTATQGYEQLESFVNFPNTVFQILSVASEYSAPADPTTGDTLYSDACGWDADPNSPNYLSCLGEGKAGGSIEIVYEVTILSLPTTNPEPLNSLVHDFSGSSFHYNSDYDTGARFAEIVSPAGLEFSKKFSPATTSTNGTSNLTFTIRNPFSVSFSNISFNDLVGWPASMQVASPTGVGFSGCGGSAAFNPAVNPGDTSISVEGLSVAPYATCLVNVTVTPTVGSASPGTLYANTSGNLIVDGEDTGLTASANLTAIDGAIPTPVCTYEVATWRMTPAVASENTNPPGYTTKSGFAATATAAYSGTGTAAISTTVGNLVNSWGATGGWAGNNTGYPNGGASPYFEFTVDTTNFSTVYLDLDLYIDGNWANANDNFLYVYSSADGVTFTNIATYTPISRTTWYSLPAPVAAAATGSTTTFRINIVGQQQNTARLILDNVIITGCKSPIPPTITKSFSPDTIATNGVSTLTFTISNYDEIQHTGVTFSDPLPVGMKVAATPAASTTCVVSPTWAPAADATTLTFGDPTGATLAATAVGSGGYSGTPTTCTAQVNVTATTAGVLPNFSGFISSTEGLFNTTASGSAFDALTVVAGPEITKQFAPNPILAGGTSTLTFTITNPNPSTALSSVAFTDTYPAGVVNTNPLVTTSNCGGTLTAVADGGAIALSGASLAASTGCTITVDVTAAAASLVGYSNEVTVTHLFNGSTTNGNTATDTLHVDAPQPALALEKQIGLSSDPAGDWFESIAIVSGADVYYKFTIENTGDVPLSSIQVIDSMLNPVAPHYVTCLVPVTDPLPVAVAANEDHITTCVFGPFTTTLTGSITNSATVEGTFGVTTATSAADTATYQTGSLAITKAAVDPNFVMAGDVAHYTFTVTNSGAATFSTLTIDDDKSLDETCPSFTTASPGDGDNFFDPGEVIVCTASYTILVGDGGSVTNIAFATDGTVNSGTDTATVTKRDSTFGHLPTTTPAFDTNFFAGGGASHYTGSTYLGTIAEVELDGTNGDWDPDLDDDDVADDDGVTWTPDVPWMEGPDGGSIDATVVCGSTPCYLAGWIDFNNDGDFDDAGENISNGTWTVNLGGTITYTFDVPVTTVAGTLLDGTFFARFRVYSEDPATTLSPYGKATDASGLVGTVGDVEDYFWQSNAGVLTPVTISYVHARRFGSFTRIEWSTSTESANVGFNIYARKGRELVRVNAELIPSAAIDSLNRLDYSFDAPVDAGHFFIEEVDVLGKARRHGPYEAEVEHGSRIEADTIDWASIRQESEDATLARSAFEKAGGPMSPVTMKVRETGFHRVSYESLRAAGIDWTGVQANDISVTLHGVAVPIHVEGGPQFGPGSFVEFHAEALDTIYTDTNVYRLETAGPRSPRIKMNAAVPGLGFSAPQSYMETVEFNRQKAYANYAPGEDAWYDTSMLVFKTLKKFKFEFAAKGLADLNSPATMELVLWGVTGWPQSPDHSVVVYVNGRRVGYRKFDGLVELKLDLEIPRGVLQEVTNTLEVHLPGDTEVAYDLVNLDRFSVTYPRLFNARKGSLSFTADARVFRVANLPSMDVVIYGREGGEWARQRAFMERGVGNTFVATFAGSNAPAKYFVSAAGSMPVPELASGRAVADLERDAEYLVIAHPSFIGGLEPLLDARRAQGLTVSVVDVNDLYERYTSGVFDPEAIRQYVAHAVKELGTKYVLLVGGDTYDYRNYLGRNSVSFIPSLYVSTSETVKFVPADPLYGDVDGDQVPDVAVGRFPVRTAAELELMIRKTIRYESKDYRRTALFASDEFDGYESFKSISTGLSGGLPANWASENIHLDDTNVAEARERLIGGMNRGTALVTFTGHSGPVEWTFDGLFNTKHAAALTNEGKPFVVVQWGCWNTYYVEPVNNYLVHSFLFSGDRGAAAVLGASTLTDSASERMLGNLLTPRITTPGMPIGQALVDAKQELAKEHPDLLDVILGWSLMGDPALVVEP